MKPMTFDEAWEDAEKHNIPTDKLSLYKVSDSLYLVKFNNKHLGEFQKDVDGFFYYWQSFEVTGCWNSFILKCIANSLDELNKEWDEKIDKHFSSNS